MAWYSTGSVSVTNGNATVNGLGTSWFGGLQAGWGFVGPDGRAYEIQEITDATTMVLATAYQGSTASGQTYACFPTMSLANDLATAFQAILTEYQGYIDTSLVGKFLAGVLGAPGISFVTDQDTGFRLVGPNDIAIVIGGVDGLRVNASGASGAAVQSAILDATSGKLMTVGAFGLGGNSGSYSPNGLDTVPVSGFYQINEAIAGEFDRQSQFLHIGNDSDAFQLGCRRGSDIMKFRRRTSATWNDWQEIFHQNSILGTVLQTAGVPTGALIEHGSNANGEYVRLADGTQICRHAVSDALAVSFP